MPPKSQMSYDNIQLELEAYHRELKKSQQSGGNLPNFPKFPLLLPFQQQPPSNIDDLSKDSEDPRHSGSAFSLVRPKQQPATKPTTRASASSSAPSAMGNSILPPDMPPNHDFPSAASPLQRMAAPDSGVDVAGVLSSSIIKPQICEEEFSNFTSLGSRDSFPRYVMILLITWLHSPIHLDSTASPLQGMYSLLNSIQYHNSPAQPLMYGVPSITQNELTKFEYLDTAYITNRVMEVLLQSGIRQSFFSTHVVGVTQRKFRILLTSPKAWDELTQRGKEPYIRMKMFLEDVYGVDKLRNMQKEYRLLKQIRSNSTIVASWTTPSGRVMTPYDYCSAAEIHSLIFKIGKLLISVEDEKKFENLNIFDIVNRVRGILSCYTINQTFFGKNLLHVSHALMNSILKYPVEWDSLKDKQRRRGYYIRLKMFLDEVYKLYPKNTPENIFSLRVDATVPTQLDKAYIGHNTLYYSTTEINSLIFKIGDLLISKEEKKKFENLDTVDIVNRIREVCSFYTISQPFVGINLLRMAPGSINRILRKSVKWDSLRCQKTRENYIRMKMFLDEIYKLYPKKIPENLFTPRVDAITVPTQLDNANIGQNIYDGLKRSLAHANNADRLQPLSNEIHEANKRLRSLSTGSIGSTEIPPKKNRKYI